MNGHIIGFIHGFYTQSCVDKNVFLLRDSSSQNSTDSQYEEVRNRPTRSMSSDQSFDEDDLADDMYSSVGTPSGAKTPVQPAQDPEEMYSLVGAAGVVTSTLPRTPKDGNDAAMYELVGSRPPSKSAPPTYEMAQSAKKTNSTSKTTPESAQESAESADLYVNSPQAEEDTTDIYSLVQKPGGNQQTSPQMQTGEDGKEKPADVVADVYSLPNINRKQKKSVRGLSIISESAECGDELSHVPNTEETPPSLPPKVEESLAMEEIKRFLEETKLEEEQNEQTNGKDLEEESFADQTVSAIQQLKEFLQRLDSTEAEEECSRVE